VIFFANPGVSIDRLHHVFNIGPHILRLKSSLYFAHDSVRKLSGTCQLRRGHVRFYKGNVHILVVEDEIKMAKALQEGLEADDYAVSVAHTGEEGFYLAQSAPFDMMILDVMLPGRDGFEILTTLRRRGMKTPILLLTSRDTLEDRVRGLDIGADDYLVKPFAFPELLARMRALLRRGKSDAAQRLKVADLEVDAGLRSVRRGGELIDLTAREFDLLHYLLMNRDRVVSREMLAREIWKEVARQTPLDNVIDAQMVRLRRKIDGQFEKKLLQTVRGVGFILRDEQS
jgi:two-component system, OmpR family, copper resistance phosphate regulon response regulator CusR